MPARAGAAASDSGTDHRRSARALQVCLEAARFEQQFPQAAHPSNGDEERFSNRMGNYSKGLPQLTVGGELNKLASNVAFGRNIAGVHWRSDAAESLRLGEEVALRFLAEEKLCFNEQFDGFSLTRFDGTRVVV